MIALLTNTDPHISNRWRIAVLMAAVFLAAGAAGAFNHAPIPLHHRRDVLALVRVDQKYHFVVPHCAPSG